MLFGRDIWHGEDSMPLFKKANLVLLIETHGDFLSWGGLGKHDGGLQQ